MIDSFAICVINFELYRLLKWLKLNMEVAFGGVGEDGELKSLAFYLLTTGNNLAASIDIVTANPFCYMFN